MVQGELDRTVVFPGLSCNMVLVVACIGSEGLLGTEALQSCLPHQLDLRTGQLWGGWSVDVAATSTMAGHPSVCSSHEFVSSASR